jgi:hypothetical protein
VKISRAAFATICLLIIYLALVAFTASLECTRYKIRLGGSPDAAAVVQP